MPSPEAAVTIVRTRDEDESVLLIRRAEREGDSWSGHWSFPGGRSDPDDRDALDTALRELEEECGIRLGRETLERELPPRIARRATPPYLLVAPFVLRIDRPLETILDPAEASGARWLPIRVLLDPASHRLRPIPARPANMLFPAVDIDGYPLWGFTYRLITSWLGLDPDCRSSAETAVQAVTAFLGGPLPDIPVDRVLDHFSRPEYFLPGVNLLQVDPQEVRIAGLAWDEYLVRASTLRAAGDPV